MTAETKQTLVDYDRNRMEMIVKVYRYAKEESSPYKAVRDRRAKELKCRYINALMSLRTTYKLKIDSIEF